jgi:hypothetical protein
MLGTIAFGTSPKNMDCARIRLLHVPAPDLIVVFILLNLLLAPQLILLDVVLMCLVVIV